jgi:hypothetical protein
MTLSQQPQQPQPQQKLLMTIPLSWMEPQRLKVRGSLVLTVNFICLCVPTDEDAAEDPMTVRPTTGRGRADVSTTPGASLAQIDTPPPGTPPCVCAPPRLPHGVTVLILVLCVHAQAVWLSVSVGTTMRTT